jgi:RNA polymerase sigma-70 factor (ECF subfamily)
VAEGTIFWEAELVARIQAGDDSALEIAYDQYSPLVHGIAVRMVGREHAGDITQEVFVTLWERPERFNPSHGSLRAFLATICRRRCIDHLRANGRRVARESRAQHAHPTQCPNVDEAALAMIRGERIRAALELLPTEQRRAVELAYLDGLTFRQVALATGASEGTAKSRIRLGLQRLADQLHRPGELEWA